MVTTKDIAYELGLAVSTVGRALADDPRISEATKLRVRQAATDMGYVANRAARMMRGASSKVVGLVIPDIRNSFYSTIAHELSANLKSQDFQLILSETDEDRLVEMRHVRELSASQAAGAIIVPTADPHRETVKLLGSIPHVQLLRRHPALGSQWFGVDDEGSVRTGTEHLIELGHTSIAYIGGGAELPTGAARLAGFRAALAAAGLPENPAHVRLGPPSDIDFGRRSMRMLRQGPPDARPTAVLLGSVQLTVGVLQVLAAIEAVRVPADLSVVGFGNEPGFGWWGPGLTTVAFPIQGLANMCAMWLMRRLAESDADTSYTSVTPGSLIVRGSTAPPGGRRSRRTR